MGLVVPGYEKDAILVDWVPPSSTPIPGLPRCPPQSSPLGGSCVCMAGWYMHPVGGVCLPCSAGYSCFRNERRACPAPGQCGVLLQGQGHACECCPGSELLKGVCVDCGEGMIQPTVSNTVRCFLPPEDGFVDPTPDEFRREPVAPSEGSPSLWQSLSAWFS